MKWAMVILDDWVRNSDLYGHCHKVIDMHDEAQWECDPQYAEALGYMGVAAIKRAGQLLELNCPLDGEYKIGHNWAMTH